MGKKVKRFEELETDMEEQIAWYHCDYSIRKGNDLKWDGNSRLT